MSSYFVIELLFGRDRGDMYDDSCNMRYIDRQNGNVGNSSKIISVDNNISKDTYFNSCLHNVTGKSSTENLNILQGTNIFWIIMFSLTTLLALSGNLLVIIVFKFPFPRKRCGTRLRPYLINLAITDLVMTIFCMPFTFIDAISNWIFSRPFCTCVLFMQVLSVAASVFTNVAIGINRFQSVLCPLKSFRSSRSRFWNLIWIWACSLGLASLQLWIGRAEVVHGKLRCGEMWPTPEAARIYTLSIFAILYAIPLSMLSVTYTAIGILLWRNPRRDEIMQSKRKVSKYCVKLELSFTGTANPIVFQRSLTRVFTGHIKMFWRLIRLRGCAGWFESSLGAHAVL